MDANTPEASQSWKDIVSDLVRHVHAEYMAQQADAIVQDAIDASEKAKQAK